MDLGLLAAFLGGVLTLLSPCSVMLLPAFFSYAFTSPSELVSRTGTFYLGLVTTLVPLGVLAGTLGAFVTAHRATVVTISALVVIGLGLLMLFNIPLPLLGGSRSVEGTSTASVYALGTIYGLAGVCAGPLLGAVLTLAGLGGNALYGGTILLVFAAGMTVPLLVLSLLWERLPFVRNLVRPRGVRLGRWQNTRTGIIGGVLTIVTGLILLLTDGTTSLGGVLGASDQAHLESWVQRHTRGVSDLLVVAVVAMISAAGLIVARRHRHTPSPVSRGTAHAEPTAVDPRR